MKLTWKHNPRVWLRDWLNKRSPAEQRAIDVANREQWNTVRAEAARRALFGSMDSGAMDEDGQTQTQTSVATAAPQPPTLPIPADVAMNA